MAEKNLIEERAGEQATISYTTNGVPEGVDTTSYPSAVNVNEAVTITIAPKEGYGLRSVEVTSSTGSVLDLSINKNVVTFKGKQADETITVTITIEKRKVFKFKSTPIEMQKKPNKINAVFYVGDGVDKMKAYVTNNGLDDMPVWEEITSPDFTFQEFTNNTKETDKNWGVAVAIGLIE